jgi:hypothetical protein
MDCGLNWLSNPYRHARHYVQATAFLAGSLRNRITNMQNLYVALVSCCVQSSHIPFAHQLTEVSNQTLVSDVTADVRRLRMFTWSSYLICLTSDANNNYEFCSVELRASGSMTASILDFR